MNRPLILLAILACFAAASPLPGQEPAGAAEGWNGARATELIRRAQLRRAESVADSGLATYQAEARIYVYFYLDREDTGERNLVKTDQLALEVFWQEPDRVKQRIVGWRDEKSLPTNIRYHLDHLTVVQENFGNEIRLGDGDEVRGVPHPAAPGAQGFYQYRLADSLILRLPGAAEPVAVYEVQVRPRELERPGFVGSVFVDRRAGDLVRMDFTFTKSAYVDRYLDYINISLENGLWEGRYWLPNQQRVEIRRRIPQLDIPAGSVIRANMRISGYAFNEQLPGNIFAGPPVVAVSPARRAAFEFEEDIFAEVREEGLGPQVELGEIRRRAEELAREQALRRVSGLAVRLPAASEVVRYNRAEGAVLGVGVGATPRPGLRLGGHAGYAFGAEHPVLRAEAAAGAGATRLAARVYQNRPRDVGVAPAASGVVNSLASVLFASDYRDLYFASGAQVEVAHRLRGGWSLDVSARAERQRGPREMHDFSVSAGDFRPLHPIDEASPLLGGAVRLGRAIPAEAGSGWGAGVALETGLLLGGGSPGCSAPAPCRLDDAAFVKPRLDVTWRRQAGPAALDLVGRAGAAFGTLPRQELYLVGGRGTVPGFDFRAFGGDRFATLQATASADLLQPWARARLLGALGWAGVGGAADLALDAWGARPTDGARASVGAGVGLFYDILRLDVARGLGDGGRWELIVEARPTFWDFL